VTVYTCVTKVYDLLPLLFVAFIVGLTIGAFLFDMFVSRPTLRIVNDEAKKKYNSLMDEATAVVSQRDQLQRELEAVRTSSKTLKM
jgi:uncharacterized membrane protein YciS (DUF1049 family)